MYDDEVSLVAVCGKGASGKDTLVERLCSDLADKGVEVHRVLRTTTRPRRTNEYTAPPPYRFITPEVFSIEKKTNQYAEVVSFRGWKYATQWSQLPAGVLNVGAYDVKSIEMIRDYGLVDNLVVVYLNESVRTLLKRYKDRTGHATFEMYRRILADSVAYSFIDTKLTGTTYLKMHPGRGVLHKSKVAQDFLAENRLI